MVSDSFGHENEVDISKSSQDKTSATGSKVAPRSMGRMFSPMEKAKKAQTEVYPLKSRGAILYMEDKTMCAVHLGVRSVRGPCRGGRLGKGGVGKKVERCIIKNSMKYAFITALQIKFQAHRTAAW